MTAFLPLFMKDHVGLPTDQIVTLDAGMMIGQFCTSFVWGWAADRYGGKPVMVLNLALLLIYPLGLMLLPRNTPSSYILAMTLYFIVGMIVPGWTIGYMRYLFVNLIPPANKVAYMALHSTAVGVVIGVCPLAAGMLLERTTGVGGSLLWFHVDPYTPLFAISIVLLIAAVAMMSTLPAEGGMPVKQFAMLWVQGNPLAAIQSLIAYQFAGHETQRVASVERLAQTRSPLSNEELIDALQDPAFNVRYEALISIARSRRDGRLTQAVIGMLQSADADMRTTAAWALGRMGDPEACPALRPMLDSPYPLLQARTARALGTLGDQSAIASITHLFRTETDPGIRVAYVAALAALRHGALAGEMLDFLQHVDDPAMRREVSLALATLVGRDAQALRLWRRMQNHPGDTLGGILLGLRKQLSQTQVCTCDPVACSQLIEQCARSLVRDDLKQGTQLLLAIGQSLRFTAFTPVAQTILKASFNMLEVQDSDRMEYLFLAVHMLHVGLTSHAAEGER